MLRARCCFSPGAGRALSAQAQVGLRVCVLASLVGHFLTRRRAVESGSSKATDGPHENSIPKGRMSHIETLHGQVEMVHSGGTL